jgi:hypothetical protein
MNNYMARLKKAKKVEYSSRNCNVMDVRCVANYALESFRYFFPEGFDGGLVPNC